jgi:uncharacterized protein with ATP-grasp and redox domains
VKTRIDCLPCIFRQALVAARHATDDAVLHEQVLRRVAAHYAGAPLGETPAHFSRAMYDIIHEVTGVADPFAAEKEHFNALALAMVPECMAALAQAADPLETGAHLAVAGNIIDLGIGANLDIQGTLERALHVPFVVNHLEQLRAGLARATTLLYVGDNAGEIVFDRIFIEVIKELRPGLDVTFAVKAGPIINDATMADAEAVEMPRVCRVIDIGGAYIGAPLDRVSAAFRKRFDTADVVIAKGQGNFETLSGAAQRSVFYILKAKCELVAEELGVSFGDSVLKYVEPVCAKATRGRA